MWTGRTISARIARGAVALSLAAALIAAFAPDLVYTLRDSLFLASLPQDERAELAAMTAALGQCSPAVRDFKEMHGYAAWRINYHVALAVLIALTTLCGGWLAWRLGLGIGRPIGQLAHVARQTASGARVMPLPLAGSAPDEVVTLHRDLTRMTEALLAADADLRFRSSAIAHDLRTPLTIIRGRLVGIQSGLFQADEQLILALLRQVGIIDQLVGDLDLLTGPAAMVLHPERCRIDQIIRQAIEAHAEQLAKAAVVVALDAVPVEADVDIVKLSRALANLLDNAVRYAPGSRLEVQVRADDALVHISLADDGPGWPAAAPEMLAQPFRRGEESRSRETGGAGLGLAIVQAVVAAHGGQFVLRAAAGGGAAIDINLPRNREGL
jgi:two-component system sensor histidine kinase AdeS